MNIHFNRYLAAGAFTLCLFLALSGCQTEPPPPPQTLSISCVVPTVTALTETKEAQEKGGLEIAVVPAIYTTEKTEVTTTQQADPGVGTGILVGVIGGTAAQNVYIEQTTTPSLHAHPDRLAFTVRVNNKLARVFRGQGAVVQFNVGGKLIPFDKTDYKEFMNGIVPPRNEAEFMIYGPPLDLLPDKGTIGIFLYDVVTATDVAGNVTEKQNYEWYFSYTTQTVEQSAEVKKIQEFVSPADFQQLMAQQQMARYPGFQPPPQ